MLRRSLPVLLLGLGLSACVVPPTSSMRLAESAYDLNTAARFGRMDIALEHVKDAARDEFSQHHATWGKSVRIVDAEMGSFSIRKDGDADVLVTVNWQRLDETTMRSTDIAQRWTEKRGTWWMVTEEERGGDRGLLAEIAKGGAKPAEAAAADSAAPAAAPAAAAPAPRARYQTRVIYEQ
jgi:hypothetical protein